MSISVKNVTKKYGSQNALDNISFEISKGEIVGFLGPNGAGKSTSMKIITCFIPQTNGEVKVCGLDVNDEPIKVKRKSRIPARTQPFVSGHVCKRVFTFSCSFAQGQKKEGKSCRND